MADAIEARVLIWSAVALAMFTAPLAAQGSLTTQDPASAQPTLPKSMPDLTVPVSGAGGSAPKALPKARKSSRKGGRQRHYALRSRHVDPEDRPTLANVELLEPLPHPPQPPHVTVPVPAYPLENFVTYFTEPPPPVVCRPSRYDRFKPDLRLIDEKPVLCTADNP